MMNPHDPWLDTGDNKIWVVSPFYLDVNWVASMQCKSQKNSGDAAEKKHSADGREKTKAHPPSLSQEKQCLLLSLPQEIRFMILRYLVTPGRIMFLLAPTTWPMTIRDWETSIDYVGVEDICTDILKVSRLMHSEAMTLLLSENKVWFGPGDWSLASDDLDIYQSLFRHVRISFDLDEGSSAEIVCRQIGDLKDRMRDESIGFNFDNTPTAQSCRKRRNKISHDVQLEDLCVIWESKIEYLVNLRPKVLELDVTFAYCPQHCCRLASRITNIWRREMLKVLENPDSALPQVKIIGALDYEEPSLWSDINQAYRLPKHSMQLRKKNRTERDAKYKLGNRVVTSGDENHAANNTSDNEQDPENSQNS